MTNDPLQALFQQGTAVPPAFAATSRYYGLPTSQYTARDGTLIVYVGRRFLPQPDTFALLQLVTVVEGDRIDNVASKYVGDPEQFWRLADANGAMRPAALLEPVGRSLRITLPQGVPGMPNAG